MTKKAFTLLEVLFAIGIFTIGILSVFTLIPLSAKLSNATEKEVAASNLSQGIMDETINLGYEQIPVNDSGIVNYTDNTASPFIGYKKRLIIDWVDTNLQASATETGLKRIKIIIYWKQNGSDKNYSLATLISKR